MFRTRRRDGLLPGIARGCIGRDGIWGRRYTPFHASKHPREETKTETFTLSIAQPNYAQVSGSLMTAVRDACRNGLLDWSPRLMLAMYSCDIQAASEFPQASILIDLHYFAIMFSSGRSRKGIWSRCEAKRSHRVRRDERRHLVLHRVCLTPSR